MCAPTPRGGRRGVDGSGDVQEVEDLLLQRRELGIEDLDHLSWPIRRRPGGPVRMGPEWPVRVPDVWAEHAPYDASVALRRVSCSRLPLARSDSLRLGGGVSTTRSFRNCVRRSAHATSSMASTNRSQYRPA